jgi:hypothetical protein
MRGETVQVLLVEDNPLDQRARFEVAEAPSMKGE